MVNKKCNNLIFDVGARKLNISALTIFRLSIFLFTFCILCFMFYDSVFASVLYLSPSSQKVYLDESFIVEVKLDTEGRDINAVDAKIRFPDTLKVIDISEGGSILRLWPEKPVIDKNIISFTGGMPNGFIGEGLILKITFRPLKESVGVRKVSFVQDLSKVLLNDGKGTEDEVEFKEGSYEIIKKPQELPIIFSETHPDQNKWYRESTLKLYWDFEENALYSYILTHNPLEEPDDISEMTGTELKEKGYIEYNDLKDGIYYFHLKKAILNEQKLEWTQKTTFKIMIDCEAPEEFMPEVDKSPSMFNGQYFLSFSTQDAVSGLDHYEVLEGKNIQDNMGGWRLATSPYLLEDQTLESIIKVKAVDKAGNERIVEVLPKKRLSFFRLAVLGIISLGIFWWIVRRFKKQKI